MRTVLRVLSAFALLSLSAAARAQISPGIPLTISIVEPSSGTIVSNRVTLEATASSVSNLTSIQFMVDGTALGLKGLVSPYVVSWDSTQVPDGPHNLAVSASNAVGASTTSAVTVIVANQPTMILTVVPTIVGPMNATIVWTTSMPSDSQADFGLSPMYGSSSMLDPTLVSTHTVTILGLVPNTVYHFRVKSTHVGGVQALSGDYTLATAAAIPTPAAAVSDPSSAKSPRRFLTPSNPTAVFGTEAQEVTIYDLRGRQVFHGTGSAIIWNSRAAESGVYIAKIRALSGTMYQSLAVVR